MPENQATKPAPCDADLVARARRGDHAAFDTLAERYRPRLSRIARECAPPALGADCVQLTLIRAWERLDQLGETARFRGWLLAICRSVAANLRSAEEARLRYEQALAGMPEGGGRDTLLTRIWVRDVVEGLPDLYRQAVSRFYFDGASQSEVAREMRVPLGTLKSRLHDARKLLREAIMETMTTGKRLTGIQWKQWWVSHLGCVKGCLEYLGIGMSDAWLYGGTGHAFILNVHEEVCPSGPTAWNTEMLSRLAPNLGYQVTTARGFKRNSEADLAAGQEAAWKLVRDAVDRGLPCFGWELEIPEFYLIDGYDDIGYHYVGCTCQEGAGPKPWRDLAATEIGIVEVSRVEPGSPADPATVVRDMVALVTRHADGPPEWRFPGYHTGPQALLVWADALDSGKANRFGQGYNAAVWEEGRRNGVAFLHEAKRRLAGQADAAFDEAIAAYVDVQSRLKAVCDVFPFQPGAAGNAQSAEAASLLREASEAEARGLAALQRIATALI